MFESNVKKKKSRVSIAIDESKKQELEKYAKERNRSLHFIMNEALDKAIKEFKEKEEYEKWVEKRVLAAYNRIRQFGPSKKTTEEIFTELYELIDNYERD